MNSKVFKKRNRIIALLLVMAMLVMSWQVPVYTYAYTNKAGVITCNSTVNVRSAASTSAEILHKLANGKEVTVVGETKDSTSRLWYKITFILIATGKSATGYVCADYVKIVQSEEPKEPEDDDDEIKGEVYATGTVTGNNVYVRNEAGTSGTTKLTALDKGHQVSIFGEKMVGDLLWYHIYCTKDGVTYEGWISGKYVSINKSEEEDDNTDYTDEEFEKYLKDQGFPSSYITKLMKLHAKYPKWQFEAVNTGLDWKTVISKESKNGLNLVHKTSDDSMKSTASGAYNWETNKWTIYDGSNWVGAHSDYIAYCMDPRNFLDETYIFQFESLSYKSSQTLAGVKSVAKGSFLAGNATEADGTTFSYPETLVEIGKSTGVSPYHLTARVRQEQGGAGTSTMISGKHATYPGVYNYFNFGAYGTTSQEVILAGLKYAKDKGWTTRYKSLLGGASLIGKNYILVGQDTLYFQKFNVVYTKYLYSHQYMGNVTAAITEGKSMGAGYTDKNQVFVFRIPVYKNMPASACTFTAKGNPNNYLKTLKVDGLELTPVFSGSKTDYTIVVENAVSSVKVSATAVASTSKVTGTGTYNLEVGDNVIQVKCKSQSGVTKTYKITITREAPIGVDPGVGEFVGDGFKITSDMYLFSNAVTKVEEKTTAKEFMSHLTLENCTVELLDANGEGITKYVGTGSVINVYVNKELRASIPVVIYGDVNGDGTISMSDMLAINRHILGTVEFTGVRLLAADVNRKGDGVTISDMLAVNRHIIEVKLIEQ